MGSILKISSDFTQAISSRIPLRTLFSYADITDKHGWITCLPLMPKISQVDDEDRDPIIPSFLWRDLILVYFQQPALRVPLPLVLMSVTMLVFVFVYLFMSCTSAFELLADHRYMHCQKTDLREDVWPCKLIPGAKNLSRQTGQGGEGDNRDAATNRKGCGRNSHVTPETPCSGKFITSG